MKQCRIWHPLKKLHIRGKLTSKTNRGVHFIEPETKP